MAKAKTRPTKADLLAAASKKLRDVIAPDLKLLFVGVNPGLYSAYTGNHFARPGNRFWPAVFAGGFSSRLLHPSEKRLLLKDGYGLTNICPRASTMADELSKDELRRGARTLIRKVKRYRPRFIAVLGVVAYRDAFDRPDAEMGLQSETIGETKVWVLPNPSGLNAHYLAGDLAKLFRELHDTIEASLEEE